MNEDKRINKQILAIAKEDGLKIGVVKLEVSNEIRS